MSPKRSPIPERTIGMWSRVGTVFGDAQVEGRRRGGAGSGPPLREASPPDLAQVTQAWSLLK